MNFSQFFNNWLYGKDGYYTNYRAIGKEGDFYTAVSSSKFFGGAIAKRLIKSIDEGFLSENSIILEIGAHKGYFLADIIEFINTLRPELLKTLKFSIIEPFEHLRKAQKEYFKEAFADEIELIHHENFCSLNGDSYFIIANEIFDAFPCELVYKDKMATVENEKIIFEKEMAQELKEISKKYNIEKGEISVGFEEFAKAIKENIKKFEFISFDYGDLNHRNEFSIRVYQKHLTYPLFDEKLNLKDVYKKSDITYDVNFAHLIDVFERENIKKINYATQMVALVEFGLIELLDILKIKVPQNIYLREINKIKTLIDPRIMGERFKMVHFRYEK